ncbi:MAG: methyltransferase domain-containing protein [Richelia sp. RM2_1_2]|nr:methyltransferase domain-containing protein [Richelia sp. SM1_7_0]NJN10912.1 methyltransferase domain-containing protein [Richelia sp. RM1_1_1]NJO30045.1 methyltransferase domain-containing protein [Richelia sp. SL_2_1]NJO61430.1 methyltransferase domain-containing protein [Richelia sp. RM2_1_2]
MNANREKDYPLLVNLLETDLDENSSLKKMLRLIGENKRVIDFGCATGYFARLLGNRGCEVIGVEVNSKAAKIAEQYCKQVIVADLDFVSLNDILSGSILEEKFDIAVFGDILEHLRNPWKVLEETRNILNHQGYIIASIPNIAHGAIRLALLQGKFEYQPLGILDNTHLRFFTRKTVEQLFEDSGYIIDVIERTKLPIYSNSDLIPGVEKTHFDKNVTQEIEQDEDADTLQFVVRGYPVSLESKYAALHKQYLEVNEQLRQSQIQRHNLQIELQESQIQIQSTQTEFEKTQIQLKQNQVQLEELQTQLQQTKIQVPEVENQLNSYRVKFQETQNQLQQIQQQWEDSQIKLQQAHSGWEHCQQIIKAMETSKFWKLRQRWFEIKHFVGLKRE